ncbi:hypothetical protein DFR67_103432 [Williamsia limnetica]|uniref:Uncharacterized protein n=1 Tax=Williamsia limnetica TaxID=882452 RepID=A0A318S5V9_WILLI|nr:hypothetical protein DFR67_103432 [Williamsia limnetica]
MSHNHFPTTQPKVTTMNSTMTLSDLTAYTGLDVFDYLDKEVSIPVVDGLQAQGDLIVVPADLLPMVAAFADAIPKQVPRSGVELLRSAAGGNPHSLVAEEGRCTWTSKLYDPRRLALGIVDTEVVAYLIHPEQRHRLGTWTLRDRSAARVRHEHPADQITRIRQRLHNGCPLRR